MSTKTTSLEKSSSCPNYSSISRQSAKTIGPQAAIVALGIITLIGTAIVSYLIYTHIGNWTFVLVGSGGFLSIGLIIRGSYKSYQINKINKLSTNRLINTPLSTHEFSTNLVSTNLLSD